MRDRLPVQNKKDPDYILRILTLNFEQSVIIVKTRFRYSSRIITSTVSILRACGVAGFMRQSAHDAIVSH
jgi:hypothetical protein